MLRGATKTLYIHAEDNDNGGLRTVNITYKEVRNGIEGGWKVLNSFDLSGSLPSTKDVSYPYTAPSDLDYVFFSFDVYSNNNVSQKAPNGGRQIFTSEYIQGKSSLPSVNIASPLYTGLNIGQIGGSVTGAPVNPPSSTSCTPGPNQAAVFTEKNYQGNCVVKDVGEYSTPEAIGLPNDSISSIKVGSGANVRLCDNSGLNSPCEYFSADDADLSNNSLGDNKVSSLKVETGAPMNGGCVPGETQVAFFMNENYTGTCIVKGVGTYNDPAAINLPNDSISSIKVGAKAKTRVCNNSGMNSPCEYFDYDDPDLSNNSIGNNTISSAGVEIRGGIALCDGTNYGGECKWFGIGKYNMQDSGFYDRAESVKYDANWANLYHTVLWSEVNQTGNPYHADKDVPDLGSAHRNRIRSIEIYKHQPPGTTLNSPADKTVFPATTTSVTLSIDGGDQRRVHVWGVNYDVTQAWSTSKAFQSTNLLPGTYYWQGQARGVAGDGAWSPVRMFTINTPPTVWGGNLTLDAGTTETIQVQASDADHNPLTLTAQNLPPFATFTDNHNGTGQLTLTPNTGVAGEYVITVTASDGGATGTGTVNLTVNLPQPTGFLAEYFNNRTLSGTPVLTRDEAAIDYDWGGGSPGSGVPADNFSVRWTKTADFVAGDYVFTVTADDGIRFYLDDQLLIDKWIDQGPTTYEVTRSLTEGSHTLKIEYYEAGGGAMAEFAFAETQAPPPPPPVGEDFQAQYFANKTLSGTPVLTRTEEAIDYDWGGGAPDPAIPADNFSVRWMKIKSFEAGTYEFTLTGDDGIRLFIDEELLIDKWIDQGPTTYTVSKALAAGYHTIKVEYYENSGGAVAKFSYAKNPEQGGGNQENPDGVELLSAPWQLMAQGSAVEKYQSISPDALQGKTTLRITYNLHGMQALGNDASAIIFDQNGWQFVSLSDYGQNGLDGVQTVDIPLADFGGLDPAQPVGTLHTRFWYGNPYNVEILSIKALGESTATSGNPSSTDGFTGEYFANKTLSGTPVLTRTDTTIDFDWGGSAPASGVPADNFSARWTRDIDFASGDYTFSVTADDGIRLFLDNQLLIDKWIDQGPTTYTASKSVTAGTHTLKVEYYDAGGGAVAKFSYAFAQTPATIPPPTTGTELLSAPWSLVGNNGASEKYQSIPPNVLAGKTTLRVTYDLHGLNALGNDASAIIFDQNGWKFVSLSNYGQNGKNGPQTVDIPLSAFGLDLSQSVGTLHTRFWYGGPFTVDITSIVAL